MARKVTIGELLNDLTFQITYNRLKNLALDMFEWEGLPEGMRPQYIENVLFHHGKALFFRDKNMGLLCLQANQNGGPNVYGEYQEWTAYGYNYNTSYKLNECVLIRNNVLLTNTHDVIMLYTNKLTEIERSLDANIKAQKFPYVITCDDKDLLTMKNVYRKIENNEPSIFADKNLNMNAVSVLETKAPFVADKLADYRHDVTNEILSLLGINNSNTDKKERLISDEVNSNNEYIKKNVSYMLESREQACEEINAMFGTNISVKLREVESDESLHVDVEGDNGEPATE